MKLPLYPFSACKRKMAVMTWIQAGLMTFIPFFYINYLRGEAIYAGKLVFIFLFTGAIGTLLGGRWRIDGVIRTSS